MVYDTDLGSFQFYNGTAWAALGGTGGGGGNFWSANGSNIYNNNTGYVGVGISNPIAMLDVARGNSSAGTAVFRGTVHASHFNFGTNEDSYIRGGTDAGNVYVNDVLDVQRTGVVQLTGIVPRLLFYQGEQESGEIKGASKKLEIAAFKGSSGGAVEIAPGDLVLQAKDFVGAQTFNAGDVGIGTKTPHAKLTILGPSLKTGLEFSVMADEANVYSRMEFRNSVSPRAWWVGGLISSSTRVADRLNFTSLDGANNNIDILSLTGDGKVGIGTTTPAHRLSVNGTIQSKEVIVETGWADYVFHKEYKLPSFLEVEKFIQQNNHLPNIPSAKEVEEKGLHLGDMQKRMMEKIEELTLYILMLEKRIQSLEKANTGK